MTSDAHDHEKTTGEEVTDQDVTVEETDSDDTEVTEKPGGLGDEGTIPPDEDGVAAGHTGEPSTFEPEEDEGASA